MNYFPILWVLSIERILADVSEKWRFYFKNAKNTAAMMQINAIM